jgi:hypothetical protein
VVSNSKFQYRVWHIIHDLYGDTDFGIHAVLQVFFILIVFVLHFFILEGPPTFGMTPDSVTIGDHTSVNDKVMDIQIKDFGISYIAYGDTDFEIVILCFPFYCNKYPQYVRKRVSK